jgi:hypothetical protein
MKLAAIIIVAVVMAAPKPQTGHRDPVAVIPGVQVCFRWDGGTSADGPRDRQNAGAEIAGGGSFTFVCVIPLGELSGPQGQDGAAIPTPPRACNGGK